MFSYGAKSASHIIVVVEHVVLCQKSEYLIEIRVVVVVFFFFFFSLVEIRVVVLYARSEGHMCESTNFFLKCHGNILHSYMGVYVTCFADIKY